MSTWRRTCTKRQRHSLILSKVTQNKTESQLGDRYTTTDHLVKVRYPFDVQNVFKRFIKRVTNSTHLLQQKVLSALKSDGKKGDK